MKIMKTLGTAFIAASLVCAPASAQSPTSVGQARAGSVTSAESLRGTSALPIIGAMVLIFALVILATTGDKAPVSP